MMLSANFKNLRKCGRIYFSHRFTGLSFHADRPFPTNSIQTNTPRNTSLTFRSLWDLHYCTGVFVGVLLLGALINNKYSHILIEGHLNEHRTKLVGWPFVLCIFSFSKTYTQIKSMWKFVSFLPMQLRRRDSMISSKLFLSIISFSACLINQMQITFYNQFKNIQSMR